MSFNFVHVRAALRSSPLVYVSKSARETPLLSPAPFRAHTRLVLSLPIFLPSLSLTHTPFSLFLSRQSHLQNSKQCSNSATTTSRISPPQAPPPRSGPPPSHPPPAPKPSAARGEAVTTAAGVASPRRATPATYPPPMNPSSPMFRLRPISPYPLCLHVSPTPTSAERCRSTTTLIALDGAEEVVAILTHRIPTPMRSMTLWWIRSRVRVYAVCLRAVFGIF